MRTYDRAEEKRVSLAKKVSEDSANGFWDYDYYDDEYGWWYQDYHYGEITLNDVRKGWLMQLLLKLRLKSPEDRISELNW